MNPHDAAADLRIRPATPAQAGEIAALVQRAYRGDDSRAGWTTEANLLDGQRIDAAQVAAAIAEPGQVVLVVTAADGLLIGCCEVIDRGAGLAYFGMFSIEPTLQAAGLGRVVLAHAERFAVEQWGAATMEMTVIAQREELIAWYVRRGYDLTEETRPFPYDDDRFGEPRRGDLHFRVLRKRLASAAEASN